MSTNSFAAGATGAWPERRHAILDWLMTGVHDERFIDNILAALCERLCAAGVPVARVGLFFLIQHPQWIGAGMVWRRDEPVAVDTYAVDAEKTEDYARSALRAVFEGMDELRRRLDPAAPDPDYSTLVEFAREGLTDYVAWPLLHTLGRRHVASFATDAPAGFSHEDIALLKSLVPAIALVSEVRLKNRFARTLLETYVGTHASAEILSGAIRRGSGATVEAAVMVCDLRDFTRISEAWPRDDVIGLLNDYFDAIGEPVERHGGEILKFIGDGLLAIFPLDRPDACRALLAAVMDAQGEMSALNARLADAGREPLGYGVGVHLGSVMYGNIGSKRRLDFTVIGSVVNTAARLETLTKTVRRPALFSRAFVSALGDASGFESLGFHPLHGHGEAVEALALRADTGAAPRVEHADAI